jgi:hypothetical protein
MANTADREALVDRMAVQMRRELVANAHKGDVWLDASRSVHEHEVIYHTVKLLLAARCDDKEGVREYAADVGNCAAMLADACGSLDLPDSDEGGYDAHGSEELHALADRLLVLIGEHTVTE